MLEARGVVSHAIHVSWEVVRVVAVSMSSLVQTGDVAEEGGRAIGADGSFCLARDCRGVVTSVRDGGEFDVVGGCHELALSNQAAVLEVAVGDRAIEVGGGDKTVLDLLWEGAAPYDQSTHGLL